MDNTEIVEDFLTQHLRASPSFFNLTTKMRKYIDYIRKAGTWEPEMYTPVASLLTAISRATYRMFLIFINCSITSQQPPSQSF